MQNLSRRFPLRSHLRNTLTVYMLSALIQSMQLILKEIATFPDTVNLTMIIPLIKIIQENRFLTSSLYAYGNLPSHFPPHMYIMNIDEVVNPNLPHHNSSFLFEKMTRKKGIIQQIVGRQMI